MGNRSEERAKVTQKERRKGSKNGPRPLSAKIYFYSQNNVQYDVKFANLL